MMARRFSLLFRGGSLRMLSRCRLSKVRILKLLAVGLVVNVLILCVNFGVLNSDSEKVEARPHFVKESVYRPVKWLIFPHTTDGNDIQDVCFLLNRRFPDWKAITFTSKNASFVRCIQEKFKLQDIGDGFIKFLIGTSPYRIGDSLGRTKAYITAIRGKADYIYVADNLTEMINMDRLPFTIASMHHGLTYPGNRDDFQSSLHFGCELGNHNPSMDMATKYKLCEGATPVLQANALRFMTSSEQKEKGKGTCLERAPPVVIKRTLSPLPIDLFNALYKKEIFWALPIMRAKDERQTSIWTYLIQACIAEAGHHIQLNAVFDRIGQGINGSFQFVDSEVTTTMKAILRASQMRRVGLADTFNAMMAKMMMHDYMDLNAVKEYSLWMKLMFKIGAYSHHWQNPQPMTCSHGVMYRPWYRQMPHKNPTYNLGIQNLNIVRNTYNRFCSNEKMHNYEIGKYPTRRFPRTALVVIYNNPHDVSIPFVEMLYRSHFPIMVHCSPMLKDKSTRHRFEEFSKTGWEFIFVEYRHEGSLSYECISLVLRLRLPVDGYLFIGDDVIFSPYDIPKFSLKAPWMTIPSMKCPTKAVGGVCEQWVHGRENTDRMKRVYEIFNRNLTPLTFSCAKNLEMITEHPNWFVGGLSDVYYLPHGFALIVDKFLSVYLNNKVHVDIAVPNIIHCIAGQGRVLRPRVVDIKGDYTSSIDKILSGNYTYLHPAKWSHIHNRSKKHLGVFCDEVMPFYHKRNVK